MTRAALLLLALSGCQVAELSQQTEICREYIACQDALSVASGAVPMEIERYGPDSQCWTLPERAAACTRECQTKLQERRALAFNSPVFACNPVTPEPAAPYPPLPPPGLCSAPRVLAGSAISRPELADVDLDADGDRDLVLVDMTGNLLQRFANDGTGRFTRTDTLLSPGSRALHVGDLTGDGRPDALLLDGESLLTYEGRADGTFVLGGFSTGFRGHTAVYGDFTGDGRLDALVTGTSVTGLLLLGVGQGDGTFAAPVRIEPGTRFTDPTAADYDGDGDLDLLTTLTTPPSVAIGRNDGAGHFTFEPIAEAPLLSAFFLLPGDLDGDGHLDVVLAGVDEIAGGDVSWALVVLFGDGDGGLTGAQKFPLAGVQTLLRLEDLDGDGRKDIVTSDPAGLVFRRVGADRAVSAPVTTRVPLHAGDYVFADLDGDAAPDFVTTAAAGTTWWGAITLHFACRG